MRQRHAAEWGYGLAAGADDRGFGVVTESGPLWSMQNILNDCAPVRSTPTEVGGPLLSMDHHPQRGWSLVRRTFLPENGGQRRVEVLQAPDGITAVQLWSLRHCSWENDHNFAVLLPDAAQADAAIVAAEGVEAAAELLCRLAAGHKFTTTGLNAQDTDIVYTQLLSVLPEEVSKEFLWCTLHLGLSRDSQVISGIPPEDCDTSLSTKLVRVCTWDRINADSVTPTVRTGAQWLLRTGRTAQPGLSSWCWRSRSQGVPTAEYLNNVISLANSVRPLTAADVQELSFGGTHGKNVQTQLRRRFEFMLRHDCTMAHLVDADALRPLVQLLAGSDVYGLMRLVVGEVYPRLPAREVVESLAGAWSEAGNRHPMTKHLRQDRHAANRLADRYRDEMGDTVPNVVELWLREVGVSRRR